MRSCKLCWGLVFVLSVVVGVFSYKFTVGEVEKSEDGRVSVLLSKDERNALLVEMRTWLETTQAILLAVSSNNFQEVAIVASKSGMGAEAETPGSLFRKLPVDMKALGFDTRRKFDEIATDALKYKDSKRTVAQVAEAMHNCVGCHASYRFTESL